jgi:signal transduction histidine kinase
MGVTDVFLTRAAPRPLRRALAWGAATFLAVFGLVALACQELRPAQPEPASAPPAPAEWRLSPPIARAPGDETREEELLLARYRDLTAEPGARAAFVADLGTRYATVGPGKRAVLGEAVLQSDVEGLRDARELVDELWALEELETAPEALVVQVDGLEGQLAARCVSRAADSVVVATLPHAAYVPDPRPALATESASPGISPLRIGLVAGLLAGGAVFLALLRTRGESPERTRQREEFFYAVTHELKTPLSTIVLCAETLQTHGRDDPEAVPRFAATIRDEAERLQGRIHQVLQLASGRIPNAFGGRSFDAASALPAIVAEYVATARQAGVRLVLLADGSDWIVEGSVELFAQALGGLLENAIRASKPGVVRIAARAERNALHVRVQDEGPGIQPERARHLFSPEPPHEGPLAKDDEGSGLGLAFVRQSIEALGGTIVLEPGERGGATFRFTVPLSSRRAREEAQA